MSEKMLELMVEVGYREMRGWYAAANNSTYYLDQFIPEQIYKDAISWSEDPDLIVSYLIGAYALIRDAEFGVINYNL